jgi:hypothetical protein
MACGCAEMVVRDPYAMSKPPALEIGLIALAIGTGIWVPIATQIPASSVVVVRKVGITSDGQPIVTFQITNTAPEPLSGPYWGEVFTNGSWQNASPQIPGAGDPVHFLAHKAHYLSYAAQLGTPSGGWFSLTARASESGRHVSGGSSSLSDAPRLHLVRRYRPDVLTRPFPYGRFALLV